MALTKAQVKEILSAAGVPVENMDTAVTKIMDGHIASVDALREQRDEFKTKADQLDAVQNELNTLKARGDADWEKRYSDEHSAFEQFKQQVEADRVRERKTALYRAMLEECGIEKSRIPAILKVTDFDAITIKDDAIENAESVKKAVEADYAGFIMKPETKGAGVQTPPGGGSGNNGQGESNRIREMARKRHEELYGKPKGDD